MAVEITISHVKEELNNLNGDANIHQQLPQLEQSIDKLSEVHGLLQHHSSGILNPEFMEAVYMVEDAIDKYHVTTVIEKEKALPNYVHLKCEKTRFLTQLKKLLGNLNKMPIVKLASTSFGQAEEPEQISDGHSDKKSNFFPSEDGMEELHELILSGEASAFHISVVEYDSKRKPLRNIYEDENVKKHFDCRAWFCVPQEFHKKQLLIDIFKQVTGKTKAMENFDSLQRNLRNFLVKKRYLVVLIDVRTPDIWEIIKFAFPNSSKGSRVIFSFRANDAERYPDIRFFGRELSVYARSKDVGAGISFIDESAKKALFAIEKEVPGEEAHGDVEREVSKTVKEALDYLDKETDIIGTIKDKVLELAKLTLLPSDKNLHIAVLGAVGSGKSTVVRTVYENTYIRRNFICRAWISISHDYDERDILIEIWKQVTEDTDAEKLSLDENLEHELTNFLSKNKFLLVLDNVHLPATWYDLQKICSPGSSNGSRVILTTYEASVARCFSPSIVILELKPLNEDDAWRLFLKKLGRDKSFLEQKLDIKRKFWKCCRGQPLAIHVLGDLLSRTKEDMDYSEWFTMIERITTEENVKEGSVTDTDKEEEASGEDEYTEQCAFWKKLDTNAILTLSYKYLPPRLKAYINYLYLFLKSDEIPVRRLFHLWIAERLGTPTEGTEMTYENQVESDFHELVQRNMIEVKKRRLDDTPKTCCVRNTLYDTFIQKPEEMEFFYLHKREDSSFISCIRRLAEHWDIQDDTPPDDWIKYLHSYLSCNTRKGRKTSEGVGNFLNNKIIKTGFQVLRVLDLEGVYKPILPKLLGKLLLLRHIGLRKTFVDSIPASVGDLPCLEIIDVKYTNITTLPKGIWEAKQLRHLYLNDISFPLLTPIHGSLTKLLTLWGLFIGKTGCPKLEWWNELKYLRKVGLTVHTESLKTITKWIGELTSLRSLRLISINDHDEPSELNLGSLEDHKKLEELYLVGMLQPLIQLPPNLKFLTLSVTRLNKDPIATLGKLQHLKVLRLFADSYEGKQMSCEKGDFPKLCVLKLWMLEELRVWTIEEQAMPVLKSLELRGCHKLTKIEELKNVNSLKELTLNNMKEDFVAEIKESIIGEKGKNVDSLKDLTLTNMKEDFVAQIIESIIGEKGKNVDSLKDLTLTNMKEDFVAQIRESIIGEKVKINRSTGKQNILNIRWD